jgi:hypothetical protein
LYAFAAAMLRQQVSDCISWVVAEPMNRGGCRMQGFKVYFQDVM